MNKNRIIKIREKVYASSLRGKHIIEDLTEDEIKRAEQILDALEGVSILSLDNILESVTFAITELRYNADFYAN